MSPWLFTVLGLSTVGVVFSLLALCRGQSASRTYKFFTVLAAVGLALDTLWRLYERLGSLSESALIVHAVVFANAMACAVLIARLQTSRQPNWEVPRQATEP